MRFVPTYCIREGSVLAKSVIGITGNVILSKSTVLNAAYIKRIATLGISGVYITDELSQEIEIVSALSDEVRIKTVQGVRDAFLLVTSDDPAKTAESAREMQSNAEYIVDEIMSHDNLLMNMVDLKMYDDYTFSHCVDVSVLSVLVGVSLGYSRDKLLRLAYGGLLHDVGKVFIDTDIIGKRGRLTTEEYEIVKRHPLVGYNYLREKYGMGEEAARGVLEHHERFDGNGYPSGLKGYEISEFGRIVAVCDVYDALVSDRSYRKGVFELEVMEYLLGGSGNLFDPEMVLHFSRRVALFPVGTCVKMSDKSVGLVVENFEGFPQRPKVKVFMTEDKPVTPHMLDLCHDRSTLDITIIATVAV